MENINISTPNDGLGDPLRIAFNKVNLNDADLEARKVDKVLGKDLSTNDYTDVEKDLVASAIQPEDFNKKEYLSTGVLTYPVLSVNISDNTKYNVSSGSGIVTNMTNPSLPVVTSVIIPEVVGKLPAFRLTDNVTYVAINNLGNIYEQDVPFTPAQRRTYIVLGRVCHDTNDEITAIFNEPDQSFSVGSQFHGVLQSQGPINLEGNKFSANSIDLKIKKSLGKVLSLNVDASEPNDPHTINLGSLAAPEFKYRKSDGTQYDLTDEIDPNNWENSGTLTPVDEDKWTVQILGLFSDNSIRIQYGRSQYDSALLARKAISNRNFTIEDDIKYNSVVKCYIVIKQGTTDLSLNTEFISQNSLTSDPSLTPTKTSQLINDGEDGISEFITFNDIDLSQDRIINSAGFTSDSSSVTMNAGWIWSIGGVTYSNPIDIVLDIELASEGFQRIDLIVANALNTFEIVEGVEDELNPISQPIPENTVQAAIMLVTDEEILPEEVDYTQFRKKYEVSEVLIKSNISSYLNKVTLRDERNSIRITGAALGVRSIEHINSLDVYSGKKLIIKNKTDHNITLFNQDFSTGTGDYKFSFPLEADYIMKPNEIAEFSYSKRSLSYEFIGSFGNYSDVTLYELSTLMGNNGLITGSYYRVSDAASSQYNDGTSSGNALILQAINSGSVSNKGIGQFYIPRYDNFDVWDQYDKLTLNSITVTPIESSETFIGGNVTANNGAVGAIKGSLYNGLFTVTSGDWSSATSITKTNGSTTLTANISSVSLRSYSIGDKVIWGGYVWENITGSVGNSTDQYNLDSTNWVKLAFNYTNYSPEWDEISYDLDSNLILSRVDKRGNSVISSSLTEDWILSEFTYDKTSIEAFQWGKSNVILNSVKDSILENINFSGSYFSNSSISGRSSFLGNSLYDSGLYIDFLEMSKSSFMDSFIESNSMVRNTLKQDSFISSSHIPRSLSFTGNTFTKSNIINFSGTKGDFTNNNFLLTDSITLSIVNVDNNVSNYASLSNCSFTESLFSNILILSSVGTPCNVRGLICYKANFGVTSFIKSSASNNTITNSSINFKSNTSTITNNSFINSTINVTNLTSSNLLTNRITSSTITLNISSSNMNLNTVTDTTSSIVMASTGNMLNNSLTKCTLPSINVSTFSNFNNNGIHSTTITTFSSTGTSAPVTSNFNDNKVNYSTINSLTLLSGAGWISNEFSYSTMGTSSLNSTQFLKNKIDRSAMTIQGTSSTVSNNTLDSCDFVFTITSSQFMGNIAKGSTISSSSMVSSSQFNYNYLENQAIFTILTMNASLFNKNVLVNTSIEGVSMVSGSYFNECRFNSSRVDTMSFNATIISYCDFNKTNLIDSIGFTGKTVTVTNFRNINITSLDFTSSSYIFDTYAKDVFRNSSSIRKIGFWDNSNTFSVHDITN